MLLMTVDNRSQRAHEKPQFMAEAVVVSVAAPGQSGKAARSALMPRAAA